MTISIAFLNALEVAAKAATRGKWLSTGVVVAAPAEEGMEYLVEQCYGFDSPNLEYIAFACPDNILKLVDDCRLAAKAHQALATLVAQLEAMGVNEEDVAIRGDDTVDFLCEQLPILKAALK